VNKIDPLGLDGIYISYRGYPVNTGYGFTMPLGHGAVIAVDPTTGSTRYFEYGRYGGDFGKVREQWVPDVVMQGWGDNRGHFFDLDNHSMDKEATP